MSLSKAVNTQRFLRASLYGPSGSGKTLTALILAEALAKKEESRIGMWDSEHGSDFYTEAVQTRACHPGAFDFDADYDKSLTGITKLVKSIDGKTHKVFICDSMTHIWEAARNSYNGPTGPGGQIPIHAWGPIKARYKAIMDSLQNMKAHVIIIGREGVEYGEGEDGKDGVIGKRMKAESETEYEMNMSIRMERVGQKRRKDEFAVRAIVEKDRTGIMQGKVIVNPTFETLLEPVMRMLTAEKQGKIQTAAEIERKDAQHFADTDHNTESKSAELLLGFRKQLNNAKSLDDLKLVNKQIKSKIPSMTPNDISSLRHQYGEISDRFKQSGDKNKEKGQLLMDLEPIVLAMDPDRYKKLVGIALKGRNPEWSNGFTVVDLRALTRAIQEESPTQQTLEPAQA